MPNASEWWLYLGTALLVAVAPGPGILYVLARSVRGGLRVGVRSATGNALGSVLHAIVATAGLSALLMTSAVAFTVVKLAGAAYLIYLGVRMLRETRVEPVQPVAAPARSVLLQGFLSEVLNPKTAMFFLAFLPQFAHPERGNTVWASLALGLIFVAMTFAVDLVVALFAGPLGSRLARSSRWRRRQQAASGVTLVGLGGVLALSQPGT